MLLAHLIRYFRFLLSTLLRSFLLRLWNKVCKCSWLFIEEAQVQCLIYFLYHLWILTIRSESQRWKSEQKNCNKKYLRQLCVILSYSIPSCTDCQGLFPALCLITSGVFQCCFLGRNKQQEAQSPLLVPSADHLKILWWTGFGKILCPTLIMMCIRQPILSGFTTFLLPMLPNFSQKHEMWNLWWLDVMLVRWIGFTWLDIQLCLQWALFDTFIAYAGNRVSYFKESAVIVWSGQTQTEEPVELASLPQERRRWRFLFHHVPNDFSLTWWKRAENNYFSYHASKVPKYFIKTSLWFNVITTIMLSFKNL